MTGSGPLTGRRRRRTTTARVKAADLASRWLITAGGIGTIGSVFGVAVVLVAVAAPLLLPARVLDEHRADGAGRAEALHLAVDEHAVMAWMLLPGGRVRTLRLDTGEVLGTRTLFEEPPTAWSAGPDDRWMSFGFADGSVRFGEIGFGSSFLEPDDTTSSIPGLAALSPNELVTTPDGGVAQLTPGGQVRVQRLVVDLREPVEAGAGSRITLVDSVDATTGPRVVALTAEGRLVQVVLRGRRNLLTGETAWSTRRGELASDLGAAAAGLPDHLLLSGLGDAVYVAWADGRLVRHDSRDIASPTVVQEIDLVPDPGERLTALAMLLGRTTLLVADSTGRRCSAHAHPRSRHD